MSIGAKLVAGLIAVLVLLAGGLAWRLHTEHQAAAAAAVAPAKAAAAVAKVADQRADAALVARIDTVTRWLHDTVTAPPPPPEHVLHPVTPADTSAAVAALPVVQQQYAACRAQLVPLVNECALARLASRARAVADSGVIAAQAAVIERGTSPRRWSLGITAGYGGTLARDSTRAIHLYTGPSLTAGLTLRIF